MVRSPAPLRAAMAGRASSSVSPATKRATTGRVSGLRTASRASDRRCDSEMKSDRIVRCGSTRTSVGDAHRISLPSGESSAASARRANSATFAASSRWNVSSLPRRWASTADAMASIGGEPVSGRPRRGRSGRPAPPAAPAGERRPRPGCGSWASPGSRGTRRPPGWRRRSAGSGVSMIPLRRTLSRSRRACSRCGQSSTASSSTRRSATR